MLWENLVKIYFHKEAKIDLSIIDCFTNYTLHYSQRKKNNLVHNTKPAYLTKSSNVLFSLRNVYPWY